MTDDATVDPELRRLRDALMVDAVVPLGMVSRLESGVLRAARDETSISWETRLAVACVVVVALAFSGGQATSHAAVAITMLAAVAYAWSFSPVARDT